MSEFLCQLLNKPPRLKPHTDLLLWLHLRLNSRSMLSLKEALMSEQRTCCCLAFILRFESVFARSFHICLVNKTPFFFLKNIKFLITANLFLCVFHMRHAEGLLSSLPVERQLNSSARCQLFLQLCKHSLFVPFPACTRQ